MMEQKLLYSGHRYKEQYPLTEFSRRDWLLINTAVASSLLYPAMANTPNRSLIRLALNENPFGPSLLAPEAIRAHVRAVAGPLC
jgi:hypothetical protein